MLSWPPDLFNFTFLSIVGRAIVVVAVVGLNMPSVTVRRSNLYHVLVHVGISVNIVLLTFMLFNYCSVLVFNCLLSCSVFLLASCILESV